ncbi:hypothetical protein A5697_15695 [Mycobacterium sp. E3251]|nr:hypothetical protein A5697_15695 [Mycobacterium sp. E3251]OBI35709.1 hypothetical protein A5709_01410 [Mycobacterium sp. E1386]OBI38401.1 hypothetical protein A5711_12140 [Mycobacterium sp. E2238]
MGDVETPSCHHGGVSAAIVVAIVVGLMLLGIGMVVNQLLRLRRYLRDSPTAQPPAPEPTEPPG